MLSTRRRLGFVGNYTIIRVGWPLRLRAARLAPERAMEGGSGRHTMDPPLAAPSDRLGRDFLTGRRCAERSRTRNGTLVGAAAERLLPERRQARTTPLRSRTIRLRASACAVASRTGEGPKSRRNPCGSRRLGMRLAQGQARTRSRLAAANDSPQLTWSHRSEPQNATMYYGG